MFIDTSAVVSIIMGEPGADRLADAIAAAKQRLTSPLVRLEACMVLSTRLDIAPRLAEKQFDAFLDRSRRDRHSRHRQDRRNSCRGIRAVRQGPKQ